jgi:hypothetical protein
MKLLPLLLALCFAGCATDTIYSNGVKVAKFQSNAQERIFTSGSISYHTLGEDHAVVTLAGGEATARIIHQSFAGLTSLALVLVPPVAAAPVAASVVKPLSAVAIPPLTRPVITAPTPTPLPLAKRLH